MIILQQMLALFFMMMLGYGCAKQGVLDKTTTKKISWLVINVANVSVILRSGLDNKGDMPQENLIQVLKIAFVIFVLLLVLARIVPPLLRVGKENYGVYRLMLVFSNISFMGMPLVIALAGVSAVLYMTIFCLLFNVLMYTYGIRCIKQEKDKKEKFQWRSLLNAGVISCVLAMIFFFTKADMPEFVDTTLLNMGNLTAPLSMLVIGQSFTEFRLRELFTDVKLLIFMVIKMLILPIITLSAIKMVVTERDILIVCLVVLSTPVASMAAMMSQQYEGNYELASKGVALSTIASVITIPVVSAIVGI